MGSWRAGAREGWQVELGSYRKERVASRVREIMGEAIVRGLNDPRVSRLTTVTRVSVGGDLLNARVYLSVLGDETEERLTLTAIRHATGYLKRLLAREMPMRQCPDLHFEIDEAAKGTRRTMELLAENRRREPEMFAVDDDADGDEKAELDSGPSSGDGDSSAGGVCE